MRAKPFLFALSALSFAIAGSALAQDRRHDDRGHRSDRYESSRDYRDHGRDYRASGYRDSGYRASGYRASGYSDRRGAGPEHNFYRGSRLPVQYRSRQYVVDDWRGHRLSSPPRGYHWVQTGGDYVLAAIATGVIATILLNN